MKLNYDWIKDFVEVRMTPQKLGDMLTMGGLEVEEIEQVGSDTNFELGITPNRSDCLSVIGVAREITAHTGKKLKNVNVRSPRGKGKIVQRLKVTVKSQKQCPRYTARVIENVTIRSSPSWVVKRLAAAGVRSINNVVDATNYVMIERGQPLHAFDEREVQGNKIIVKKAGDIKKFRTLDGVEHDLHADDLLICDAKRPIALAGIMGGENSEVADDTKTVILESAYFEPNGVRRTSKHLGCATESSRRFERGIDPNGVRDALDRLTQIIVETAGGMPTADAIDVYPKPIRPMRVTLPVTEIKRVVGIDVPKAEVVKILSRLGFTVSGTAKAFRIGVPTYRHDVLRPVDVVEEIVRIYGYHRVPETLPQARVGKLHVPKWYAQAEAARLVLTNAGFAETVLTAFDRDERAPLFAEPSEAAPAVLANPLSREESMMRRDLVTGLFDAAQLNYSRQRKDLKLYALQRVYTKPVGDVHAEEPLRLAGLMMGRRDPLDWQQNARQLDFYDAKASVEAVVARLGLQNQVVYQRGGDYNFLVNGSYATVLVSNDRIGWVGQIHPEIAAQWDIEEPVYAFEIDFETLAKLARTVKPRFREISRFPFVERDLSILIDHAIPHVEIERTISQSLNTLLTDVRLFDVYRGKGVPEDKKSMTYAIRYASDERTLTDDEVREAHAQVIDAVITKLDAVLR